jgi:tetratricopeptide (TPR) repeat protein
MMPEHKTVFISYRRTNIYIARSLYLDLRANGYDVFLDYEGIDSGDWQRVILNQIEARAHFVLILTPSALERCVNGDDNLRMEIEHAIDTQRNLVPLIFPGFDYKLAEPYLVTDKLKLLPKFNSMNVPDDYFEEAMTRLRTRFLSRPLEGILMPTPPSDQPTVQASIQQAEDAPKPTTEQLKAEDYFERGVTKSSQGNFSAAIEDFTHAINLNSQLAEAYYRRGNAYFNQNESSLALQDYVRAVRLVPGDRLNNIIQSKIHRINGDYDRAFSEAEIGVKHNPDYCDAYFVRGNARKHRGDPDGAINDYSEAIRLNPYEADYYYNRGRVRQSQSDIEGAIADYNEAIRLNPEDAVPYIARGIVRRANGDSKGAIADYETALQLEPNNSWARENLELARRMKGK